MTDDGHREYTDRYAVVVDEPVSSAKIIMEDSRTPKRGSKHRDDPKAQVKDIDADTEEGLKWILFVNYTTDIPDTDNPFQRPPVIRMRSEHRTILTFFDIEEKSVLNTAGDLLAAREIDSSRWIFDIQKNFSPSPYPTWLTGYQDVLNIGAVRIRGRTFPKGTLKVSGLTIGDETIENDVEFIPVSLEIKYQSDGWDGKYLNVGFNEIGESRRGIDQSSSSGPVEVIIPGGHTPILIGQPAEPTREPQFLDFQGKTFRDGNGRIRTDLKPAEISSNLIKPKDYQRKPFSVLPLK